jgi:beta-N-acetylhexosaminidase
MNARAFITGLSGFALTADERAFLREARPWGLILFKRNVNTPDQVIELIELVREAIGGDAPVLVDQEGGRVQRLGPPHWAAYPPGAAYYRLFGDEQRAAHAIRLAGRLIAADIRVLGIDVNCVPLADVPVAGADSVIGDRAYADTPERVATMAAAVAEGMMDGGVLPVLKHIPGHGRANADSHLRLPVVHADRATLEATDFAAFRPLKHLPLGMTAHVVYSAIDPVHPATTSATIMREVIRGSIGFGGLLMSDDISMGALSGSIAERTRAALAAGCDLVLHCNGKLDEMREVAGEAPELGGAAARRAAAALAARKPPAPIDLPAARREFAAMMNLQAIS